MWWAKNPSDLQEYVMINWSHSNWLDAIILAHRSRLSWQGIWILPHKRRKIASWCLKVYVSEMDYELGVATVSEHRKQGMATIAASACVNHCSENGFTLHWHCWNNNEGSIALAAKPGLLSLRGMKTQLASTKAKGFKMSGASRVIMLAILALV